MKLVSSVQHFLEQTETTMTVNSTTTAVGAEVPPSFSGHRQKGLSIAIGISVLCLTAFWNDQKHIHRVGAQEKNAFAIESSIAIEAASAVADSRRIESLSPTQNASQNNHEGVALDSETAIATQENASGKYITIPTIASSIKSGEDQQQSETMTSQQLPNKPEDEEGTQEIDEKGENGLMSIEAFRNESSNTPPDSIGNSTTSKEVVESFNLFKKNKENKSRQKTKKEKPKIEFTHFLSHVPKSGASYAMNAVNSLIWPSPEWHALPKEKRFRICNEAKTHTKQYYKYRYAFKGNRCTMWMSERGYTTRPQHIYTIIREPKQHVLSMYFHCKESKDHASKAHRMPPLDEWLDNWVDAIDNETKVEENRRFSCYSPINHQSQFVKFNATRGKDDLKERYTVIGDNSQMPKSVCMIFIRYTGWVPKECDCTSDFSTDDVIPQGNATKLSEMIAGTRNSTIDANEGRRRRLLERVNFRRNSIFASANRRRRLAGNLDYDPNNTAVAHGVQHHGATFQTTQHQDEQIAKLRNIDLLLYEATKLAFAEQVHEVETEYNIKVCDKFRD